MLYFYALKICFKNPVSISKRPLLPNEYIGTSEKPLL